MKIHDLIGIGFGPAGIALAAAFDDHCEATNTVCSDKVVFLEARATPAWQRGLLFRNTDIQHHYLRDLATPRNPRSRYTFANFLKEHERLFEFGSLVYGGGGGAVSRIEWSNYVAWAAQLLAPYVRYDSPVTQVGILDTEPQKLFSVSTPQGDLHARALAFCAGQDLHVPDAFRHLRSERMFHATEFLDKVEKFPSNGRHRIAVVGAGQAAIEVTQYLHSTYADSTVYCIQRSVGFQHGNHSPFVQRMFHPKESDVHFGLSPSGRVQILEEIRRANYAAVDKEAVSALYRTLYEDSLLGQRRVHMMPGVEITSAMEREDKGLTLSLRDRFTGKPLSVECDIVVLATGFAQRCLPSILQPLVSVLEFDELGHPVVEYDYALRTKLGPAPAIYVPGLAEYSHGLGSSNSFSMIALKAERVVKSAIGAGTVVPRVGRTSTGRERRSTEQAGVESL